MEFVYIVAANHAIICYYYSLSSSLAVASLPKSSSIKHQLSPLGRLLPVSSLLLPYFFYSCLFFFFGSIFFFHRPLFFFIFKLMLVYFHQKSQNKLHHLHYNRCLRLKKKGPEKIFLFTCNVTR